MKSDFRRVLAIPLAALVVFCVLAGAAHDLWAATVVHVAALALFTALLWTSRKDGLKLTPPPLAASAAVAAAFFLSFLGSVHAEESRLALLDWTSAFLVLIVVQNILRDDRARDILLATVAAVACVEEAVILRQHWMMATVAGAPQGLKKVIFYVLSMQLPGTMVNASAATAFFLLWCPVFAGLIFRRWQRREPVPMGWKVGLIACSLGLLSLDSNWGMICLLVLLPLIGGPQPLLSWIRRHKRTAATVGAAAIGAFALLLAWKFGHTHNMNGELLPPGETTRRLYWWVSGLKMLRAYPWLGVGIGNFPSAYLAFKAGAGQHTLYPHNNVIGLLAETGFVGFGAMVVFLGAILRRWARDNDSFDQGWPFFLGLASFILFGLMGLSVEYLANLLCAGIFLGALAATAQGTFWKPRLSILIVMTAAAISMIPFLVSPWMASRDYVEGQSRLAAGDTAGALHAFASAIKLDRLSSQARQGRSRALVAQYSLTRDVSDIDEALRQLVAASVLDNLNGELRWELANILRAQGRREEALANYTAAARLNPKSERFQKILDDYRSAR